jgi:segregation and condensation protein B
MSLKAQIEAVIYVAEEPVTSAQLVAALRTQEQELSPQSSALSTEAVKAAVAALIAEYRQDGRGLEIKEVAGGYKMATKPEHHEVVSRFVKSLKPPVRLSLAALETLAVVAYRQPVTLPEIQEVRGVNAAGVMKNLLEKRLITTSGRKAVIGRPILYRTTRDFLVQFGLKDVSELPSLNEFEELSRAAVPAE